MIAQRERTTKETATFDTSHLDLSALVGRGVVLFTEQFPGKPLVSRVIEAAGQNISIDRSGGQRLIDNLVHNQSVVVQFDYRGERVSIGAQLKRTGGGKCSVALADHAQPLSQRRFVRVDLIKPAKMALMPTVGFDIRKISRLRWFETDTVDLSSGGAMIDLSSRLDNQCFLLMNVELEGCSIPPLLIGQVRYSNEVERGHFHTGVEFIVDRLLERHFGPVVYRNLPAVVFEMTAARRSLHKNDQNHRHSNNDEDDGQREVQGAHSYSRRAAARAMSRKDSASNDAPPTSAPSMSSQAIRSAALDGLTDPP